MTIQSVGNLSTLHTQSVGTYGQAAPTVATSPKSDELQDRVAGTTCSFEFSPTRAGIFQVMMPASMLNRSAVAEPEPELQAASLSAAAVAPGANATSSEIAAFCNEVAKSDMSLEERTDVITDALAEGVEKADTPDETWTKATKEQLGLFVMETLEHVDSVRAIGELRGLDFDNHDLEPGTGKFNPEIAQYLALPGRDDSVQWAINTHNGSAHHATWHDSSASVDELAESATDIVNAWRMNRRVYNKPPWSWERITGFIETQFQYNELSVNQRDALLQAIPYQMDYEHSQGIDLA